MTETSILHAVRIGGTFANTVAPREVVDRMYPVWEEGVEGGVYSGAEVEVDGILMQPFNSALRFQPVDSNEIGVTERHDFVAVSGNTVTRLCPIAQDCGSCMLSGVGMTTPEMSEMNCARANTAMAFEAVSSRKKGRFVLQPTSKNAFVLDDSHLKLEKNGGLWMQSRLQPAESVVITQSWLNSKNMKEFAVGMNGADGSFGIATTEIMGERIFIPFCSMRGNMGDRGEDAQILRKAINTYLDILSLSEQECAKTMAQLSVSILIGASATLRNFAHKIQIPEEGSEVHDEIMKRYSDLVERAGRITSAIVLEQQYPGALERGSIFPEFEAQTGIHTSPITPDNCPGDGQTCHIDYRVETEYALRQQLVDMGITESNIHYDDTQAMDPADPANIMASNRAEQNNGVVLKMTNRTINGIVVRL